MVSGRPLGDPGGPCLGFCSHFRQFHVHALWMCCVQSASLIFRCYITRGAVTSYVTSQLCTCTGHMIGCYKRSALLARGTLSSRPLVQPSGSPLSPVYGWCLMRVGRDASSASPGWSLLPSSVIIVLALVNSTMSPGGLRYLNETWKCRPTPCQYHFHRTAVPFGWCLCASW